MISSSAVKPDFNIKMANDLTYILRYDLKFFIIILAEILRSTRFENFLKVKKGASNV